MKKLIISISIFVVSAFLGYFGNDWVTGRINERKSVVEPISGAGSLAQGVPVQTEDKVERADSVVDKSGLKMSDQKELELQHENVSAVLKVTDAEYYYIVSGPAVKPDSCNVASVRYCLEYSDGTKLTSDTPSFKKVQASKGGCVYYAESEDYTGIRSKSLKVNVPVRSKITPLTPEKLQQAILSKDFNLLGQVLSEHCLKKTKSEYDYRIVWADQSPDGVDTVYDVQQKIVTMVWETVSVLSVSSNYLGYATKFTISYTSKQYE